MAGRRLGVLSEAGGGKNSQSTLATRALNLQQKAKVICTGQLEHYVAAEQARDEHEVQFGSQDHVRDEHAIKGAGKLELYHLFVSDTCYCSMGYWAARSATDLARQPSENTSDTYTGL